MKYEPEFRRLKHIANDLVMKPVEEAAPPVTWDSIVKMYEKLGADWSMPRVTTLRVTAAYAENIIKNLPKITEPYMFAAMCGAGIQLITTDKLCYGEWEMVDQYGNVMKEYKFPVAGCVPDPYADVRTYWDTKNNG